MQQAGKSDVTLPDGSAANLNQGFWPAALKYTAYATTWWGRNKRRPAIDLPENVVERDLRKAHSARNGVLRYFYAEQGKRPEELDEWQAAVQRWATKYGDFASDPKNKHMLHPSWKEGSGNTGGGNTGSGSSGNATNGNGDSELAGMPGQDQVS